MKGHPSSWEVWVDGDAVERTASRSEADALYRQTVARQGQRVRLVERTPDGQRVHCLRVVA